MDSPLLVTSVAFMLGLFIGWMVWGRPSGDGFAVDEGATIEKGAGEVRNGVRLAKVGSEDKLALIAAEISKARADLDNIDTADAAMSEELDKLDHAVNRANGRLKLILKSAERAQNSKQD